MRNSSRGHTRQCRAAENAIAVGVRRLQMEAQEEDHEQRSAHGKRQIVNLINGVLHVEGTKGATPPPLIIADKCIARASPPTFLQSINPINTLVPNRLFQQLSASLSPSAFHVPAPLPPWVLQAFLASFTDSLQAPPGSPTQPIRHGQ